MNKEVIELVGLQGPKKNDVLTLTVSTTKVLQANTIFVNKAIFKFKR